jgi:hypothetical protein
MSGSRLFYFAASFAFFAIHRLQVQTGVAYKQGITPDGDQGSNMGTPRCKRRLKSAAGGARKVLHLPGKEDCFFRVSSSC